MAAILVVDDSNFARRTLRRVLEEAGHLVSEADDGLVALEQYALQRPDVVFLDLTMRGMSGFEALKRLREIDPHARVIIASADIQSSTRQQVLEAGAVAFLSKPFLPDQVLQVLKTAIEEL